MKKYKIPVQYMVSGFLEIEAASAEEAIKEAVDNIDDYELPYQPEYVDDSFEVNDDLGFVKYINGEVE
jgi:hypothetical protein